MSRKLFDFNINDIWEPSKLNLDNSHDTEKELLLSLKYEDTVFICIDKQHLANKLAISKYSSKIRKLILEGKKTTNNISLPDVYGHDFFLFKHFVYTKNLYPLENMTHYFDISFTFESQDLMKALYRYIATDNGNITELLEFLKFQYNTNDSSLLNVLLNYRKVSLEKLRTSMILMSMGIDELTKINITGIINSWNALEAFTFIEYWILKGKGKRNSYRDFLYSCVNLSSFDLKYSKSIPSQLYTEIIKRCNQPEQIEYVRKIYECRQKDISDCMNHENAVDYKSFSIEFWRRQNIKKLTQECGSVNWFNIVNEWFSNDKENNIHYLIEMLQHVDFTQIDSSFLSSWINENTIIFSNENVCNFFKPYITTSIIETNIERIERKIKMFRSLYCLPDTPLSIPSSEDLSIPNVEVERNVHSVSNIDGINVGSLNKGILVSSIENDILTPKRDTSLLIDTPENVVKEEGVLKNKSDCSSTVLSRHSSNETLTTVDGGDCSIVDDVFQDTNKLDKIETNNNPEKTALSQRYGTFSLSSYLSRKKSYQESCNKGMTTETIPSHVSTTNRNVRSKRSARRRLSYVEDYDRNETGNEMKYNVNIVMIGGVSGINKGELKPARNLFYNSKNNEYEYFPELNRDRTLTKIAEYEGYLFAVGGKIYVNGKWDSALEFCRYDKSNGYWSEMDTCLESSRYDHDVAVIDDKMFIVGGNSFKKDKHSVIGYDFPSERFFKFESTVNDYIYQHSNIVKNNAIYVVGGYKFNQSRLLYRFDPRIGKFETLSTPSFPHLYSATVLYGERIYCIGGRQSFKDTSYPLHYNEVYDIRSNKWNQLSPMPTPRVGCGGSIIGNEIFVFGGATKNGGTLKIVEKYNIFQDKWKTVKPMSEERGFFGIYTLSYD